MTTSKLALFALSAAAAGVHAAEKASAKAGAADDDAPEPINYGVLVAGLCAIVAVGLGLMVMQTPEEMRTPAKMLMVKTKNGMEFLPKVIVPNLIPALTVTLVSIPLSLALGIATGTSPMAGIATAVVGGLVSGGFGDSAFNIVGPAGALVGILMRFTAQYGPEVLPWLSLISGCMIVLALMLRVHEYCMFMPKAVFEGFTVSVALTIGLGQTDFALGLSPGPPLKVEGLELSPGIFKLAASLKALDTITMSSTIYFLVGFIVMQILFKIKPTIPWMVPFAVVSCFIGCLCDPNALGVVPVDLPTLRSKYGVLSCWIATGLKPITEIVADAEDGSYGDIFMGSISVTIVAVLETLISAQIAKNRSKMPFDQDKELQGLALSHFACGLCGIMPPTGVFVRTSVNFATGATHKASQFFQGMFVLIFAAVMMPVLSYIPQGAIAAILVTASVRMVPWGYVFKLAEEHRWWFGLLVVVALMCWLVDSVTGLVVGTMVALLVTGKETARGHAELSVTAANHERLKDGAPKMISIDAMAVDDVDLARQKNKDDSDDSDDSSSEDSSEEEVVRSKSYVESKRETAAFKRQASDMPTGGVHSHMAYAPEFDHIPETSPARAGDWGRQESTTSRLFMDASENEALQPTGRGDRVFVYKFLGQLDFLSGDKHVDRFQAMLASGPKGVVLNMQNVPWVDPDGMEALRDIIVMLEENLVQVYIAGARPKVKQALENELWYMEKMANGKNVFPNESAALLAADPPVVGVVPGFKLLGA